MTNPAINFIYFGGEPLGVPVLEELKTAGLIPSLIVCSPDRPVGRKQTLTPPPTKVWAEENSVPTWQPESYKGDDAKIATQEKLTAINADVFVVVAYNFILPQWLLDVPAHGVVNVHPSMLPYLRGASPIRTAIKDDLRDQIGVTIMQMDAQMDNGPILDQMPLIIKDTYWPLSGSALDKKLAKLGGSMLAEILPEYVTGDIFPQEQEHNQATYCGRFTKDDSEIELNPHKLPTSNKAYRAWLKINAFDGIDGTFFRHNEKRIKIKEAEFSMGKLRLLTVIPEGKNPQPFAVWLDSLAET
jgi:methionyl-tRNA formyltransferase